MLACVLEIANDIIGHLFLYSLLYLDYKLLKILSQYKFSMFLFNTEIIFF